MSGPATEDDEEERIGLQSAVRRSTYEQLSEHYPHALNDAEIVRMMAQDVLENMSDE